MSKLRLEISNSTALLLVPQSVENPPGIGSGRLHEWAFQLAAFRALLGLEDGCQRKHPGRRGIARQHWRHGDGAQSAVPSPVFVRSHHAREPLELKGGRPFTFVTGGIAAARANFAAQY